jgi:hypothetical protein
MFQGQDIWLMIYKMFEDGLTLLFTESVQVRGLRLKIAGKS